jgi:hypothetical protein
MAGEIKYRLDSEGEKFEKRINEELLALTKEKIISYPHINYEYTKY